VGKFHTNTTNNPSSNQKTRFLIVGPTVAGVWLVASINATLLVIIFTLTIARVLRVPALAIIVTLTVAVVECGFTGDLGLETTVAIGNGPQQCSPSSHLFFFLFSPPSHMQCYVENFFLYPHTYIHVFKI